MPCLAGHQKAIPGAPPVCCCFAPAARSPASPVGHAPTYPGRSALGSLPETGREVEPRGASVVWKLSSSVCVCAHALTYRNKAILSKGKMKEEEMKKKVKNKGEKK